MSNLFSVAICRFVDNPSSKPIQIDVILKVTLKASEKYTDTT